MMILVEQASSTYLVYQIPVIAMRDAFDDLRAQLANVDHSETAQA